MAPGASVPPSDNAVFSHQVSGESLSSSSNNKLSTGDATDSSSVAPHFGAVAASSSGSEMMCLTSDASQAPTAADVRRPRSPKRAREQSAAAATVADAATTSESASSSSSSSQPEGDSSDSSSAKKPFRCPFPGCGKEFQLKGNLKRHQNIHAGDKKFRCSFCGKDFLRKADMEVHHRVHTGEKPYKCKFAPECDKSFARRSDLLSHERTHIGTKPFACLYPGCGRHFARKFDLQKHRRMHDNHSSECQKRRKISSPSTDDCDCWSGSAPLTDKEQTSPSATASPTLGSPASAAAADVKTGAVAPVTRYQLTCTQDHIHSPPACFAAFTSMESLDDSFLLSSPHEAFDLKPYISRPIATAAAATADGCCSGHEHVSIKRQFAALEINGVAALDTDQHQQQQQQSPLMLQHLHDLLPPPTPTSAALTPAAVTATFAFSTPPLPLPQVPTSAAAATAAAGAVPRQRSTSCCPIDAELLKDYAKHTPSCGHLSIVHGDHRDYVVKNHLVCQDSVRSISGGGGGEAKAPKCPANEPHRPGCGHLAVRHRDHIDYVVEDNLFCQQAGLLGEVTEHIELLDDDFWDFYGAVGSLTND